MEHQTEERKRMPSSGGKHVLHPGPLLTGHRIQRDEEQHAWIIDRILVACSPLEDLCLQVLLENSGRVVPFEQLRERMPEQSLSDQQVRMRLAHVMSSLRPKIWALGLDIVSVMGMGYLLWSQEREDDPSPED